MTLSKRSAELVSLFGGVEVPYKDHSLPVQQAISQYLSVDGEAWKYLGYPITKWHVSRHKKIYGEQVFGLVHVPMDFLVTRVMQDEDLSDFGTFAAYHKWYMKEAGKFSAADQKKYFSTEWPCFLSCYDEEVFEDGWHRFHTYFKRKVRVVPCVYFPKIH